MVSIGDSDAKREHGPVGAHTAHYLDVVDKYRNERERSYHYHHLTINLRINGPVDAAKMANAVEKLCAKNPALRSYFAGSAGHWTQNFAAPGDVGAFSHQKFDDPELDWKKTAWDIVNRLKEETFDVLKPPLFKVVLLEFPSIAVILTKWHHIVCDGWGIVVALNQLLGLYAAEFAGVDAPIPALPVADYIALSEQQNAWLQSPDGEKELQWWRDTIGDHAYVRTPLAERPQGILSVCMENLSANDSARLQKLADAAGYHVSFLVYAAFLSALRTFTGSDDVLVTFVKANRDKSTGHIVGNFADWVTVRHRAKSEESRAETAAIYQKDVNEAKSHYVPYWSVVKDLCPGQYFKDFGLTPYSFDFTPPLPPAIDVGAPISFGFLHELEVIPYRLTATDIFCRMSMHTHPGEDLPRIDIGLIYHSGHLQKASVEKVLADMKHELAETLKTA
ncbi:MAG: hypothetical protein KDE14_09445 [Rhodobacteraceae bacterium]|nr:hypothetical protein [Paracoccaceae bacterium]